MSKTIPLTQGYVAIVDDHRYDEINAFKWCVLRNRWGMTAQRSEPRDEDGKQVTILMHRQVVGALLGEIVDHANRNTLDNRETNLRRCTSSQNNANALKRTGGSSRFKGVDWCKKARKWRARIGYGGLPHHLGYFDDEEDAARAYNEEALKQFREFALLNEV